MGMYPEVFHNFRPRAAILQMARNVLFAEYRAVHGAPMAAKARIYMRG